MIRLQEFARPDVYVHSASQVVSGGSAQSPNYTGGGASRAVRRSLCREKDSADGCCEEGCVRERSERLGWPCRFWRREVCAGALLPCSLWGWTSVVS